MAVEETPAVVYPASGVDSGVVRADMAAEARAKVGLSQQAFALLLGVSARTLQDWEQGRRSPTGAAKTLLRVAVAHPEVLQELRT